MSKSLQQTEKQAAIESLRKRLKPGMTIYTILDHVSRSGMQRTFESTWTRALRRSVAISSIIDAHIWPGHAALFDIAYGFMGVKSNYGY